MAKVWIYVIQMFLFQGLSDNLCGELVRWLYTCDDWACLSEPQNAIDSVRRQPVLICDQEERVGIHASCSSHKANLIRHFHALQVQNGAEITSLSLSRELTIKGRGFVEVFVSFARFAIGTLYQKPV